MRVLLLVLVCIGILITGCSDSKTPDKLEEDRSAKSVTAFYDYTALNSYVYTSTPPRVGTQEVSTYRVIHETDGTLLIEERLLIDKAAINSTRTWIDPSNLNCVRKEESTRQSTIPNVFLFQSVNCPPGEIDTLKYTTAHYVYVSTETMMFRNSSLEAKKYVYQDTAYWISDGIPLPLKISLYNGALIKELRAYS